MEHHECERGRCSCDPRPRDITDTYEPTHEPTIEGCSGSPNHPHGEHQFVTYERCVLCGHGRDGSFCEPPGPFGFDRASIPRDGTPLVKGGQGRSGWAVEESVVTFGYFVMGVIVGGTAVLSVRAILWAAGWLS